MGNFALGLVLLTLLAGSFVRAADKTERTEEFRKSKAKLVQKLRSKHENDRIDAIRELCEHRVLDAAKILAQVQLIDSVASVREEALMALISFNTDPELCNEMRDLAKKEAASRDPALAIVLLAVLLSSDLPDAQTDALAIVDDTLGKQKDGVLVVSALADELGRRSGPRDLAVLEKLATSKMYAEQFPVRRAVVQAIANVPRKEAIGVMIKLLPGIQGEAQADALHFLTAITGQQHAGNIPNWQKWWQDEGQSFAYPASVVKTNVRKVPLQTSSMYYEIPIYARRLVFVMDTSGSMAGERLAAAKRELASAIMGLGENTQFTVLVFNGNVFAWQKRLVPANSASKRQAVAFVEGQQAQSQTSSYNALEMALTFDAEAIYFLTDGAPSSGKIVNPPEIVAAISKINRAKRESIYTIGIGVGPQGGLFDMFLSALAEQNLGEYRRVDQ